MKVYRFRFFSALIIPLVIHTTLITYLALQEEPLPPKTKQLVRVQTVQLTKASEVRTPPLVAPVSSEAESLKPVEPPPEPAAETPEPAAPPPAEKEPLPEEKAVPVAEKETPPETKPVVTKEKEPARAEKTKAAPPKTPSLEKPAAPQEKPPSETKPAKTKSSPKKPTAKEKEPSKKQTSNKKKDPPSTAKKKSETAKSEKTKDASDETLSAALDILSSLKNSAEKTASKAVKGAIRAGQFDSLKSEAATRFDSPGHRALLERSYQDEISYTMQGSLVLPEQGEVVVLLTLSSDGKVKTVKIKRAESTKNSQYVSEKVPHLRFASFRDLFKGEKEHTFTITLCNK